MTDQAPNPDGLYYFYGVGLTESDEPDKRYVWRSEKYMDGEAVLKDVPVAMAHKIVDLLRQAAVDGFADGRRHEREHVLSDIQKMFWAKDRKNNP